MVYAIIYIIGFIINLTVLAHFGKALGFDYNKNNVDRDTEDWSSNAQAYAAFSLMWPVFDIALVFMGIWKLIMLLTGIFVKD